MLSNHLASIINKSINQYRYFIHSRQPFVDSLNVVYKISDQLSNQTIEQANKPGCRIPFEGGGTKQNHYGYFLGTGVNSSVTVY